MKWFKASLWLLSLVILLAIGAGAASWFMLRGTPDWYRTRNISPEQRKKNEHDFENTLVDLTNKFGEKNAAAYRAAHPAEFHTPEAITREQAQKLRTEKPDEPVIIEFTDDQLNAFFDKWSEFQNRRAIFEQYVENPRILMRKNQLVLAGLVKEMGLVVSMEFNPKIDADGNLRMDLVQVTGGILPLPDSMWMKQRQNVEKMLAKKLPEFQDDAAVSKDGYANGAAASAAMNEMVLAALYGQTSSAVVFVPGSIQRLSPTIPVKITSVSVTDHTLTMTAQPMSGEERQQLVDKIKAFDPDPQAEKPDPHAQ